MVFAGTSSVWFAVHAAPFITVIKLQIANIPTKTDCCVAFLVIEIFRPVTND